MQRSGDTLIAPIRAKGRACIHTPGRQAVLPAVCGKSSPLLQLGLLQKETGIGLRQSAVRKDTSEPSSSYPWVLQPEAALSSILASAPLPRRVVEIPFAVEEVFCEVF